MNLRFPIGARVEVRTDARVNSSVYGRRGRVDAVERWPGEKENQCWVEFDQPVAHYSHGQLVGLWLWESALRDA